MSVFINKKKQIVEILAVTTIAVVTFFACSENKSSQKIEDFLAEKIDIQKEDFTLLYNKLLRALDEEHPGKGNIDYGGGVIEDIPKSYAMVLSLEIMCAKFQNDTELSEREINAANWLLANADINQYHVFGRGLPVALDAFGDGSENPENTEYTITNGRVIDALLDWDSFSKDALKEQIKTLVLNENRMPMVNDIVINYYGRLNGSWEIRNFV